MKKYIAPEMNVMAFVAEETVAANAGSNIYNDADFGNNW